MKKLFRSLVLMASLFCLFQSVTFANRPDAATKKLIENISPFSSKKRPTAQDWKLLDQGADINYKFIDGYSLIHLATLKIKYFYFLLANGAKVNVFGYQGMTPLMVVAGSPKIDEEERFEMIAALLLHGADPTVRTLKYGNRKAIDFVKKNRGAKYYLKMWESKYTKRYGLNERKKSLKNYLKKVRYIGHKERLEAEIQRINDELDRL